jgi:hypothetical protein
VHAVVVRVKLEDIEAARRALNEQVVPELSQAPEFVTGYWALKGDSGVGMIIFESEDAASAIIPRLGSLTPEALTFEDIDVYEVEARA